MTEWKVAGAPGAWGVEDSTNRNNPKYSRVLNDASAAGYKGIELGPYGYMPMDVAILEAALAKRSLKIVAATIYDDLLDEDNIAKVLEKTHKTCQLIAHLPEVEQVDGQRFQTPYLVIIDSVKKSRDLLAGHPEQAEGLDDSEWSMMMTHIKMVARIAASYGIRAVLHPHAGGYVEFEDEIAKAMNDLSPEEIGLCLDTGHLYYSKMDPGVLIRQYGKRLDYVHFKDIHGLTYEKVMAENIGFFDGCNLGVMCPIGSGVVDYREVKEALKAIHYNGWITIEQERDPLTCDQSIVDAIASITYLKNEGFDL